MHASIWLCHVIARYNLFGRTPKELFFYVAIFGWRTFGASIFPISPLIEMSVTEILICGWKERLCCSFWTSSCRKTDVKVFNTCFTSSASVEHEQRVFYRRPSQWMTAFTHGQLQNVLLTLAMWNSHNRLNCCHSGKRLRWCLNQDRNFFTINGVALM